MKRRIIAYVGVLIISMGAFSGCLPQEVQVYEEPVVERSEQEAEPISLQAEDRVEEGEFEKEDVAGMNGQGEPETELPETGQKSDGNQGQPANEAPDQVQPIAEEPVIEGPATEEPVETPEEQPIEEAVETPAKEAEAVEPPVEEELVEPEPVELVPETPIQISGTYSDLFIKEDIQLVKNPDTVEAFKDILLQMCATDTFAYSIEYTGIGFEELLTSQTQAEIAQAFDQAFNTYPEYFSFSNRMTYKAKGGDDKVTITFTLSSDTGMDADTLIKHRKEFFDESVELVRRLEAEGKLTSGQSDRDKAQVLYEWLVNNAEYDNSFHPESYTGYGVYENGLGVCQGYTAVYNALCKIVGLDVEGVGGTADGVDHIWTRALFAGSNVFIDATWGDSYVNSDQVNFDYFLVDGSTLSASHSWQ